MRGTNYRESCASTKQGATTGEVCRRHGLGCHCLAQGLGTIDHEQLRAVGGKPAFDKIGKPRFARGSVLGRTLAQAQDVLLPADVEPERRQHEVIGERTPSIMTAIS